MSMIVRIPTPLRKLTEGKGEIEAEGANVKELIDDLEAKYPGIKAKLCDDTGEIRKFINVFLNEEDIRFKENMQTLLKDGDDISIVPAIAGGICVSI